MRKILSCEFKLDSAYVELRLADGALLSIDCTAMENEMQTACTSGQNWPDRSTAICRPMPN